MNRAQRRADWIARHRHEAAIGDSSSHTNSPDAAVHLQLPAQQSAVRSPHSPVEFHIEELVLSGFNRGARHSIGEAVEHELTRFFTDQGVPPQITQARETPRIDAGSFHITQGEKPGVIGAHIANAVYGGVQG